MIATSNSLAFTTLFPSVMYLSDKRVAEFGAPEELMKRRGLFFQMATRQDGITFDDEGHATMEKKRLRAFWLFSLASDDSLFRLCAMFVSKRRAAEGRVGLRDDAAQCSGRFLFPAKFPRANSLPPSAIRLKEGERLFSRGDSLDTVHFVASGRLAQGEQFPKVSGPHTTGGAAPQKQGSKAVAVRPSGRSLALNMRNVVGAAVLGHKQRGRKGPKQTTEGVPARVDFTIDDGGVLNEGGLLKDVVAERDCWALSASILLSLPRTLFQQVMGLHEPLKVAVNTIISYRDSARTDKLRSCWPFAVFRDGALLPAIAGADTRLLVPSRSDLSRATPSRAPVYHAPTSLSFLPCCFPSVSPRSSHSTPAEALTIEVLTKESVLFDATRPCDGMYIVLDGALQDAPQAVPACAGSSPRHPPPCARHATRSPPCVTAHRFCCCRDAKCRLGCMSAISGCPQGLSKWFRKNG